MHRVFLFFIAWIIAIQVKATDCDFSSFNTLAGWVNLTVKAKVIELPNASPLSFTHYEASFRFVITKRYYGFAMNDTIRIWLSSYFLLSPYVGYPLDLKMGDELLLNLIEKNGDFGFGTCGEYMLRIKNDTVTTYDDKTYALSNYEEMLQQRYGKFVQLPYRLIAYGDTQFMESMQLGCDKGEFKLKTTLPDGAYFVFAPHTEGFVIAEEVYLQKQHRIGKYRSFYLNGKRKESACYTMEGILDKNYYRYHNNERSADKEHIFYDNGRRISLSEYWPDWTLKTRISYDKDSNQVLMQNEKRQILFKGVEIKGRYIGEHCEYNREGKKVSQYYTDEKGRQGILLEYFPNGPTVTMYSFRNDTLQGKSYSGELISIGPLKFDKGKIISPIEFKTKVELNYVDGLKEGPQYYYFSKKEKCIHYYKNGVYINCEGSCCVEF